MSGKEKYKLSKEDIEAIQADRISTHSSLARKYDCDHTTIMYHRGRIGKRLKIAERQIAPRITLPKNFGQLQTTEIVRIECDHCGEMFDRMDYKVNRGNNFCSAKCCRIFNSLQRAKETETKEEKLLKKQEACEHKMFMVKCSTCGKILGSEKNLKIS